MAAEKGGNAAPSPLRRKERQHRVLVRPGRHEGVAARKRRRDLGRDAEKPRLFKQMPQPVPFRKCVEQLPAALGERERAPDRRLAQPGAHGFGIVMPFLGAIGFRDLDAKAPPREVLGEACGALAPGEVQEPRAGGELRPDQAGDTEGSPEVKSGIRLPFAPRVAVRRSRRRDCERGSVR